MGEIMATHREPKRPMPSIRDKGFGKQVEEADEIFDQTLRNYN